MEHDLILDEIYDLLQKQYPELHITKHSANTNPMNSSYWINIKGLGAPAIFIIDDSIVMWSSVDDKWEYIPLSDPDSFEKFLHCFEIILNKLKDYYEDISQSS